jgi:hypothetical protein
MVLSRLALIECEAFVLFRGDEAGDAIGPYRIAMFINASAIQHGRCNLPLRFA